MVGDGSHKTRMVIAKSPLEIKEYTWGGDYRPKTVADISYEEDKGFTIIMRSYETQIRAENKEENTNVYEDSCMEFFVNFYPEENKNYINFEVNANGAMLCAFGANRSKRTFIKAFGIDHPDVQVHRAADYWEIKYLIPFSLIKGLYGRCDFPVNHKIRANFYKCGDKTKYPHYGSWSAILTESPDFHQPDYFGELEIK